MPAPRRRTTRNTKKSQPRRGPQKASRPSAPRSAKKTGGRKKQPVSWRDQGMKAAIALFIIVDVFLIFFFIKQCAQTPVAEAPVIQEEAVKRPLQIEVLNGCGVGGIANVFTEFLRAKGFDVVKTDNYVEGGAVRFNIEETTVVDRRGEIKKARRIAKALGLGNHCVLSEPNEAYLIDATVILGADYLSIPAWKSMEK